ncbi:hypothetical protein LINPERPRIM_LOCUS5491 [Linum perenne]
MKRFNPDIVILVEPRVSGSTAESSCRRLGFENYERVEAIGFSGGIWVLWHPCKVNLRRIQSSHQLLHMEGEGNGSCSFLLTAVYGSRSSVQKPFRFLAPWLRHQDFKHCLQSAWSVNNGLPAKLLFLSG